MNVPNTTNRMRVLALLACASVYGCALNARSGAVAPAIARADSIAKAAIANERSVDVSRFSPRSVGVAPLAVDVSDTSLRVLGFGLADLLTTDLAVSASLEVVERVNMDALLRELGLASSGRVDSATAPRLGRLTGARRLVTGSVVQLPDSRVTLNTRIADASTGAVQRASSPTLSIDAILDAEKALAFSLFDQLGANLTPSERAKVEQRPTRSIGALVAYSRGVRREALGDFAGAAREYQAASRIDPSFNRARDKQTQAQQIADAAGPAPTTTDDPLRRALSLAGDPINRPALPTRSDAADPSFRSSAQKLVTIIIPVNIP